MNEIRDKSFSVHLVWPLCWFPAGGSSVPNLSVSGDPEQCEGLSEFCSSRVSPECRSLGCRAMFPLPLKPSPTI